MLLKTMLKYAGLTIVGILAVLLLFILIAIAPVDRTPVNELESYDAMMRRLDTINIIFPKAEKTFAVGFGKINITPDAPMATAGYGKRRGKPYHSVHDSIYVRSLVLDNGADRVAIISADLLIIPPAVTEALHGKLAAVGFSLDNTYLGATHSHNSIGQWGKGAAKILYGAYEDSVVRFIADAIVASIGEATRNLLPSTLRAGAIAIPQAVHNRLIDQGEEDPFLRVLEVHRGDSSKLVLMSYAAHATCLSQNTLELSRDYPGVLVDELESSDYDFAMFLAGGVGSHTASAPSDDWSCMSWMARQMTQDFLSQRHKLKQVSDSSLGMRRINLPLSTPQIKISQNWKLRGWLFRTALGEYDSFLTVLRIGDVIMMGTPGDFSGEFNASLDSVAKNIGVVPIVTSFNGGYIGYLTPGRYFDIDHDETRFLNWYALGTGDYVAECLARLMIAASDTK